MYRHKRKAIVGEAVQFTEDGKNDSLIASWFSVHPQRIKETNSVAAHTLAGVSRRAERGKGERKGDWLIRTKSGGLYICPEADFEEHYMKMEESAPPTGYVGKVFGKGRKHDAE